MPVFQGSFGCVFTCVKGHFVFVFHQQLTFTRLVCVTRTFCVSPAVSTHQTCLCYKDILCVFHQQLAFTKVILTLFACIKGNVCVCVPPAISIHQTLEPSVQGKASFQLIAEYYNRNLSGWEPFLEPWRSGTAPPTLLTLPLASCFCYTLSHLFFSSLHHDIRDVLYTKIVQSFLQHAKKKKRKLTNS